MDPARPRPGLPKEEWTIPLGKKLDLLRAGILPFLIFFSMTGLFFMGWTNLVENSAVGVVGATLAALFRGRLTFEVPEATVHKTLAMIRMFTWIILAALCFGAVFDGLGAVRSIKGFFLDRLGLGLREALTWRWTVPALGRSGVREVDSPDPGSRALAAPGPGHME